MISIRSTTPGIQQGKNISDVWIEEAGQYPGPEPIDRLFGALRSVNRVPVQMILTGNPGGVGQHWIAQRYGMIPFPRGPKVIVRELPDGAAAQDRRDSLADLTDNKLLPAGARPGYHLKRLQARRRVPELIRAMARGRLVGDRGRVFQRVERDRRCTSYRHSRSPRIGSDSTSADWGSARPFMRSLVGRRFRRLSGACARGGAGLLPRNGMGAGRPSNVGLKLPPENVAAGVASSEIGENITSSRDRPGSVHASDGGPSIAERLVNTRRDGDLADNKRVGTAGAMGGWDIVRKRLIGTATRRRRDKCNQLVSRGPDALRIFDVARR